jgi:hypothetical protein
MKVEARLTPSEKEYEKRCKEWCKEYSSVHPSIKPIPHVIKYRKGVRVELNGRGAAYFAPTSQYAKIGLKGIIRKGSLHNSVVAFKRFRPIQIPNVYIDPVEG